MSQTKLDEIKARAEAERLGINSINELFKDREELLKIVEDLAEALRFYNENWDFNKLEMADVPNSALASDRGEMARAHLKKHGLLGKSK